VTYADRDKIRIEIRSAVPEGRLIELCQQVDAAVARIVRVVPFRTTYRD
jgi:hypothetical protein